MPEMGSRGVSRCRTSRLADVDIQRAGSVFDPTLLVGGRRLHIAWALCTRFATRVAITGSSTSGHPYADGAVAFMVTFAHPSMICRRCFGS